MSFIYLGKRDNNKIAALILLVYSMLTRFLTSIYSIIYNKDAIDGDGACFYVIGKAIMQGKVLYKDIFDHKTPYIYFINGLASLLEYNHIGLFLVEVLILFVTLYFIFKILILFFENEKFKNGESLTEKQLYVISLIGTFIMGIILSDFAITEGYYRTEPYAVALIMPAIYMMAKYYYGQTELKELSKQMFVIGLLAGLTFMINIKGIALFVPLIIPLTYDYIKQKEWFELLKTFCFGIVGVAVSILPYIIYMIVTDSVNDMLFAVVDTNLAYARDYMEYNIESVSIDLTTKNSLLKLIAVFFIKFPVTITLALLSILLLFFYKHNCKFKIAIFLQFVVAIIILLSVGRPHFYYLYILLPYLIIIYILFVLLVANHFRAIFNINKEFLRLAVILSFVIMLGVSFIKNNQSVRNSTITSKKEAEQLRELVRKYDSDFSKLNVLSFGYFPEIYLWLNVDVKYKYFVRTYMTYNAFRINIDEQVKYISSLEPDIFCIRNFAFVPKELERKILFSLNYYYDLLGETERFYVYGKKR